MGHEQELIQGIKKSDEHSYSQISRLEILKAVLNKMEFELKNFEMDVYVNSLYGELDHAKRLCQAIKEELLKKLDSEKKSEGE